MISIDYQNRKPIYEQIVERFQILIIQGILTPDSQIPSVRTLAMDLSINPNTIQKAYALLEQQGYIYPIKGRGNFVAHNEHFIQQKRGNFFEALATLFKKGIEIGITQAECTRVMEAEYKEVSHD